MEFTITEDQFNGCLSNFNRLLIDNLTYQPDRESNTSFELKFITNYLKSSPSISYTKIELIQNHKQSKDLNKRYGIEFTISFHELYKVPIFYFRLYDNDTLILFNEDLLSQLSEILSYKGYNVPNFLIESHHIYQEPWLSLHPCETSDFMTEFIKSNEQANEPQDMSIKYLLGWFTNYGLSSIYPRLSLRVNNLQNS
ncbi:uncharacterized protein RJT21DRAFT_43938 [Scheffersomyces amazonensis]|uniref:uncharacterized protein n=1 Tax=Scheffersomyces amazonensis TaxID=1078765 RepID=UPI00315CB30F